MLEKIELDSKISVLILKGSEKSFAAGADIAEMEKKEFIDNINMFNIYYISKQIEEIKKGVYMRKEDIKRYPSKKQIKIGIM